MPISIRRLFQGQRFFGKQKERSTALALARLEHVAMIALTIALGTGAILWILSDFSGQYEGQDNRLGLIRLELQRHATTVSGTLTVGDNDPLKTNDGYVRGGNKLALTFVSPIGQAGSTHGTTYTLFYGVIDPARITNDSSKVSFEQVLHPMITSAKQNQKVVFTVPKPDIKEKIIRGTLEYRGIKYPLMLTRNPFTSLFYALKSLCPGRS